MRQIVLISGHICVGKSSLAQNLEKRFGYYLIRSSSAIRGLKRERLSLNRLELQEAGDELDRDSNHKWLLNFVIEQMKAVDPSRPIVVDNVRNSAQLRAFREQHDFETIHVHLYANNEILEARYAAKQGVNPKEKGIAYPDADLIKNEDEIRYFQNDADVRIFTGRSDQEDVLVRVAAHLGLYPPGDMRTVDVIVGGQYGSEGKGHVAGYLAREYDVLVRVGGPNAGHTVSSALGVITYHQLPSGAEDTDARLLLGPGMTIRVPTLLEEIRLRKITPERLFIDPQAMIIEEEDIEEEQALVKGISSTGQGGGAAAARRIMGRSLDRQERCFFGKAPPRVRLARDVEELRPYVGEGPIYRGSTVARLEEAYRRGDSILLEGTQGSGLSLFHGLYPHVTSRDTNVAGCLAEAGISPSRVRKILMVVRYTPIRVANSVNGNTSGLLKHEVTFEEVADQAGIDASEVKESEKTSTTRRDRRVGWFEWEQFRKACALNAPTDIVLTFADYISAENRSARRFDQLPGKTIKFIEELETVAQAPVSLVNIRFPRETSERFDLRTLIDRRNWTTQKRLKEAASFMR